MTKKINVLIIEDNLSDLEIIKYELQKSEYSFNIFEAENFNNSLDLMNSEAIDIILTEYNVFGKTAIDLLQKMNKNAINIPVILSSSEIDDAKITKCFELGVKDYINKEKFNTLPYSINILISTENIRKAKEKSDIELSLMKQAIDISHEIIVILDENLRIIYFNQAFTENLGYNENEVTNFHINKFVPDITKNKMLKKYNLNRTILIKRKDNSKFNIKFSLKKFKNHVTDNYIIQIFDLSKEIAYRKKLIKKEREIQETLLSTFEVLAKILEFNDPYTGNHQQSVSNFAVKICQRLNLSKKQQTNIKYAALLHDIGKLSIPISILIKPGKLTPLEFKLIKNHSLVSYEIIKKIKLPKEVKTMALQHHERINGSGYPYGLKDSEILLGSKIIAVADITHAISSRRPYREALGIDVAIKELIKNRGILYDEKIVDIALTIIEDSTDTLFD